METIELDALRQRADRIMRELGWDTPEWEERMRNKGSNRSPAKRELLRRAEDRALAAGVEPVKSYY